MERPNITDAPGIAWRPRADGWACLWVCRGDIAARGYTPVSARLRIFTAEPDDIDRAYIQSECRRRQARMLTWANGGTTEKPVFDGSWGSLFDLYQTDPDSRFAEVRFSGQVTYGKYLSGLKRDIGQELLGKTTARDIKKWHRDWIKDGTVSKGHYRVVLMRQALGYGIMMEVYPPDRLDHCKRLKAIMNEMVFETGGNRKQILTLTHARNVIAEAHRRGWHEIALGQALQYDLRLRKIDVVGEWIPVSEPGTSAVTHRGRKWVCGMEWREIGADPEMQTDLALAHRISKSIRGRTALADPSKGNVKRWNLRSYPLVMQELAALEARDGIPIEQRTGPIIVDHTTGLPFWRDDYANEWREIARAANVPDEIQLRDSRAGGLTESAIATNGDLNATRQVAGHKNVKTTIGYLRAEDEATEQAAQRVIAFRAKNEEK